MNYSDFNSPPLSATPDTYRAYPGAIDNSLRADGSMVNFSNPVDFALVTGTILNNTVSVSWEANQRKYKPDSGLFYTADANNGYYQSPSPGSVKRTLTDPNGSFGFTNKQFLLTLAGPAASNAVISASTDLQSWVPLLTNQLSGGTLQFTDTLATNYLRRFYRAMLT